MAAVCEKCMNHPLIKCENKVTVFAEFIALMHDACCDDAIQANYRTDGASLKQI